MRELTKDNLPKVVLNHKGKLKDSIYMQPLLVKDKDGNVVHGGGKESVRNIGA